MVIQHDTSDKEAVQIPNGITVSSQFIRENKRLEKCKALEEILRKRLSVPR